MANVTFSEQEMDKLMILKRLQCKDISQIEAAATLGFSTRHMRRLQRRISLEGNKGIKKRRRIGNRAFSPDFKNQVMAAVVKFYSDFGPTFASEKLLEREQLKVSKETLRHWMIEGGFWKGRTRKQARIHQSRHRRPRFGELIQLDGSPHDWFEGRAPKCCLLVLIDDATSKIVEMRFELSETTQGYFRCLLAYVMRYGRCLAVYSDRHSIFKTTRHDAIDGRFQETQLHRALTALGIELITANSPQAKGRVERANQTMQDRLIKQMRLEGISSLEEANAYLPQFIEAHNKKFAVEPESAENAHRTLHQTEEGLKEILSIQKHRKLSKNLEFSFEGKIYQVQKPGAGYRYRSKQVTVCEQSDGTVKVKCGAEILKVKVIDKKLKSAKVADRKTLDALLDAAREKDKMRIKESEGEKNAMKLKVVTYPQGPQPPQHQLSHKAAGVGYGLVDNLRQTGHL